MEMEEIIISSNSYFAGVEINEGYGVHSGEADMDTSIKLIKEFGGIDCIPCKLIYPREFGCNEGGEDGIFFHMETDEKFEEIRQALKQTTLTIFRSCPTEKYLKSFATSAPFMDMGVKWQNSLKDSELQFSSVCTKLGCFGVVNPNRMSFTNKEECVESFKQSMKFDANVIDIWCKRLS